MFSKLVLIFILLAPLTSFSSWNGARSIFEQRSHSTQKKGIIKELIAGGYYFSALPLMKEYLISETRNLDSQMEAALSKLITAVGVKQFETLPYKYLIRSKSNNIRYVIAKKYMRDSNYNKALLYLNKIPSWHVIYPFAKNMEATIYSIQGHFNKAMTSFNICKKSSRKKFLSGKNTRRNKLNRDSCIAGKARTMFAAKKYTTSDLLYLDIPKSSPVWPEILFEEAWNSYYLGNYNRSLGKLVSYKSPVFESFFNPEVDVLTALSYLKLCLYQDAKKISNDFYKDYLKSTRALRTFLKRNKTRYSVYYDLLISFERLGAGRTKLMTTLLKGIEKEETFKDLKRQFSKAADELNRIRAKESSKFKRRMVRNTQESISSQKKILGAHTRARLVSYYAKLYRAFEGMSYIKLEVLAQRKAKLYSLDESNRERGDIKYIQRNEKQYFWNFNGEFWADELGDYVFALRSEC
ncbi:MAG: hypothetical protein HON90_09665 [Halobacteriovoraceae bacterium]|jgi:hypothetical protein|nr:hypothetical protein [Halobacteriovoraceae bacterium]